MEQSNFKRFKCEDGKEYIVTLEAHENGYYFVSNVETE